MIFVDSNVPMYMVGAPHIHKSDTLRLLERFVSERERLVTDAEVFQEILHRYISIRRRYAIENTFNILHGMVDEVFPVDLKAMERAKQIVLAHTQFSARDAVHLAVMQNHGVDRIFSFDAGFDRFPGVIRLS